jgi:transcriptional regulator GlxA family with amidase domain
MRGANAYITKPFNETELLHIVHNLLETRQRWKNRYKKFPQINAENAPSEIPVEDIAIEDAFFRSLYNAFEQHYTEEDLDLEGLCRIMHMSSSQLDRKIKTLTDKSPIQMLRTFRLQKAKKILLESPDRSVSDVCFLTGFKSPAHFSRLFAKEFGVPPSSIQ